MPPKKEAGKNVEKKVQKLVEDKTFGLKNKNKSKKVQQYVASVTQQARGQASGGQAKSAEYYAALEAKKKKEKEEKKALEKEMLKMLGDMAGEMGGKSKKKLEEERKAEEEQKKAEAQRQHEHDFSVPITPMEQIFRVKEKSVVPRACAEVVWMNNLPSRTKDGSKECVFAKISDGTTRLPFPVTFIGWNPTSVPVRTGDVVDIRDAIAMVRGEGVDLEVTLGLSEVEKASPTLADHIRNIKAEAEEVRERGGIPIEELIEEQRAKLRADELIPVTEARFLEWKARKLREKKDAEEKARVEAESRHAKGGNVLSGRQLFMYDPSLFKDDEEAEAEYEVPSDAESVEEEQEDKPAEGNGRDGDEGGQNDEEEEGEGEGDDDDDDDVDEDTKKVLAAEEDVDVDDLDDDDAD